MIRGVLWVFLLAGLISPMVNGQFTQDYETTDDSFDDIHDDDQNEEYTDTNDDYGDVFDDYFDDEMRVVDVDQDVAIKACVSNSDALVKKIDSAYDKCFKDFEDWNEFQKNNVGNDKDKDGLSDEYEADEACFYKKMGWVVNNKADKEAIKKDFENLNLNNVKNEFVSSIDACSGWNGKFKGRKKRDAEEDSWALSLARERRAAQNEGKRKRKSGKGRNSGKGKDGKRNKNTKPGKGKGKNKKETGKKGRKERRTGKNGNGRKEKKKNKNKVKDRKDRKNKKDKKKDREDKKIVRNGKGKGNRKGKGNGNRKGKDKGNRKGKGNGNRKGKGKGNGLSKDEKKTMKQLLPESVYNQLWCYELSVERALEECIEAKILP